MKKLVAFTLLLLAAFPFVRAQEGPPSVIVYKKDTAFTSIAVDSSGNVYAGTNGKGLWKFDQKSWKNWSGLSPAFAKSNLRQIATAGSDVWVATSGYVFYLGFPEAGNNNNFYGGIHKIDQSFPFKRTYFRGRHILGQQRSQGPPTRNVLGVWIDSTGTPWCAASYHDSTTYVPQLNYNARYHYAPGAVGRFDGANFSFITGADLPDPTGILIGIGNNYKDDNYSIGKRRTCRSITQVGAEMWVGSDGYDAGQVMTAGILRYRLDGTYIGKYDQTNTPVPFGTTNADFGPWSLCQDSKGRAWAGMNGFKGIAVMDSAGWHYIGVPAVLPSNTVFRANAIAANASGEVFFGTSNGLLVYKGSGPYTEPASYFVYTTAQGLSSNSVFSIAIAKDQSIWAATTAGVNKIERGNLFVYNRKPNAVIFTDVETLRTPVIHYDSKKPQEFIDRDTLLISADGGRGTIFKWVGTASQNVKFRIAEDPDGSNTEEFGSFSVRHQSQDSVRVLFSHPKFVGELYTVTNDGGRTVRLEVVDAGQTPEKILLAIPVRFVLPPVLMVHGVWSSVTSFDKMETSLLASFRNYKPFSLLRIWYKNDKHPEPAESQAAYNYVVPDGIDKLVENCALHKMSVGKVDVLAHSRGGIFSRIYLQGKYLNYRNDINKLITLNTPHSGSQQANLILDKRVIPVIKKIPHTFLTYIDTTTLGGFFRYFALEDYDDINGAVELKVNSPAITLDLNGPGNLNRNTTYSHAIVGRHLFGQYSFADVMKGFSPGAPAFSLRLIGALIGLTPADDMLKSIFNGEYNDIVVPESSQQGGLAENFVTRFPGLNVAHSNKKVAGLPVAVGVLDIPDVHFKVASLLRAKASGGLFATDGYDPPNLKDAYTFLQPNPPFVFGTPEKGARKAGADPFISIDSTLSGRAFAAGDTVAIKILKSNVDTVVAGYSGASIGIYSDVLVGNDTVFKFPMPKEAIGAISIEMYGFKEHRIAYDSAIIFAGTPAGVVLDSIRIVRANNDNLLTITKGDSVSYRLDGFYSDGIVRDLTAQLPKTHAVVEGNIGAALPNKIRGLAIGYDQLTVSYEGKSDSINVEVVPVVVLPALVTLPVKFVGITARFDGEKIVVNWRTAQEVNNDHFEIEHSTDGSDFVKAGAVAATNKSGGDNYSFYDLNFAAGKNFYRIKQIDADGGATYSNIAFVSVATSPSFTLYPNPASKKIKLLFSRPLDKAVTLRSFNAAGQNIHQQVCPPGIASVEVQIGSWPKGVYLIEIDSAGRKISAVKMIKN